MAVVNQMKLSELHRVVNLTYDPNRPHRDQEVMVVVKLPYATVGSHPMRAVKSAGSGFDWENGKFMIWPEESLQPVDKAFADQFAELQKKYGWLDYENRNLKAEVARLRKKLKEATGGISDADFKNDKFA